MNFLQDCSCPRGCVIEKHLVTEIGLARSMIQLAWSRHGISSIYDNPIIMEFIRGAVFTLRDCVLLQWLFEQGVQPYHFDHDRDLTTALSMAIGSGCVCILQMLIEKNPEILSAQIQGKSALQYAIEQHHPSKPIIRLLLNNGAIEIQDCIVQWNGPGYMRNARRGAAALNLVCPKKFELGDKSLVLEMLESGVEMRNARVPWFYTVNSRPELCQHIPFYLACGATYPRKFQEILGKATALPDNDFEILRAFLTIAGCPGLENIDAAVLKEMRRLVACEQFRFVKNEAIAICFGLQSLELPAFVTLQIIDHSWQYLADLVPMHLKWKLVTLVKHFHDPKEEQQVEMKCEY